LALFEQYQARLTPDDVYDLAGGEIPRKWADPLLQFGRTSLGLILSFLYSLSTFGHPPASTRSGRRRKAATEPKKKAGGTSAPPAPSHREPSGR
jgi:hypothetical protein